MRYRRAKVPGATYFFTVNLADRKRALLVDNVDLLRTAMGKVKRTHPFQIEAVVIMPDHLHAIWRLPRGDADFSMRWNLIKAGFSRQLSRDDLISPSRMRKGERGIWQRRFWEHLITDDTDYMRHVDYIHYNPVKHGYVGAPAEWRFSSVHRYIKKGIIPADWGGGECEGGFGER